MGESTQNRRKFQNLLTPSRVANTSKKVDMTAANERDQENTCNEETRRRDQRVRSSLLVCVTKRIKHLAIRGNFKIISGGGELKLSFRTNIFEPLFHLKVEIIFWIENDHLKRLTKRQVTALVPALVPGMLASGSQSAF